MTSKSSVAFRGNTGVPLGRYWRQILSNIPDSVTVYDSQGNVVYANELASQNLRHASAEHLMEQNITDIASRYIIHNDQGELMSLDDLPTRRALLGHVVAEAILHISDANGADSFWLSAKAFPIINGRHNFRYVVSTYHEITNFKEAEEMLKESNRRMLAILDDLMNLEADQ